MKLYHFTSPLHVDGCIKEGITKGMIPITKDGKLAFIPNSQWLTSNPNRNQEWVNGEFTTLPYDRTEFTLQVNIPKSEHKNLFKWLDICGGLPILQDMNSFGDPENWWVFHGRVKPSWIRKITHNTGLKQEVPHD